MRISSPFSESSYSLLKSLLKEYTLNGFSQYRIKLEDDVKTISANWVQSSTVTQEQCTLELFHKHTGEFSKVAKSEPELIKTILSAFEAQNINAWEEGH